LTELSTRAIPPALLADEQGLWRFTFAGDETYIDDLGVEFYWSGIQDIITIRGVAVGTFNYTETASVAGCRAIQQSFFWDDANKRLYVHHEDNANDYTIGTTQYRTFTVFAGYASSAFPHQPSYYPRLFFDPVLRSVGSLSKAVDPLKFGLLSFTKSTYTLENADGKFDDFSLDQAFNSQIRFVVLTEGQTDIEDGVRLFTGYTAGVSINDQQINVQLQEERVFYNRATCPNVFTGAAYPNIDDTHLGKPIPVAYGDIRRGIAVPIDTAGFDKASASTITFKLADDSIHAIRSVTALYDSNGNSLTLGTIDLTACTVQYAYPGGADIDLKSFSWEGEGYDLGALSYNNGLDIMRDALANQGELPYTVDTFETTVWDAQTAANPQPIGLSLQTNRGLVEQIIEPITVSLQGIVDTLADGRLTFRPRDPLALPTRQINQEQILNEPAKTIEVDEVVSSLIIDYSPNFAGRDDSLSVEYTADQTAVTAAYGIVRSRPISPVQSVLTTEADALALAVEIASTSSEPQILTEITTQLDLDQYQLFEVIQADIGRPGAPDIRVWEILGRTYRLDDGELLSDLQLRQLQGRTPIPFGGKTTFTEGFFSQSATDTWDEGPYSNSSIDTFYDEGTL